MEKNSVKYLLGIAVIAIWGLLGYRIYQKVYPPVYIPVTTSSNITTSVPLAKDSFTLLAKYRDPFEIETTSSKKKSQVKAIKPKNKPVQNNNKGAKRSKPFSSFPKLLYKGLITVEKGNQIALVTINGQMIHLKKGQEINGLILNDIFTDSIQVKYQGNSKTFRREN